MIFQMLIKFLKRIDCWSGHHDYLYFENCGVCKNCDHIELNEKGMEANFDAIKENIEERDYLDIHRKVSPLLQATDACVLDNSTMNFAEQMHWFISILKEKELLEE